MSRIHSKQQKDQKQTSWLEREINENWIKPNKKMIKAILEFKLPISRKEIESVLRALQYFAKILPRLSEKIDRITLLIKTKKD